MNGLVAQYVRMVLEDLAAWLAGPATPLPSGLEAEGQHALCGRGAPQGIGSSP